ncbi:MAG TPA: 50S ribosomal protein L9 [Deltaproteobacteria bacterium]|nr:50S ribosomal protein L9 [Deltaproteobacteria bacterium]
MEIILKERIPSLGDLGDVVKVAPGYARNYLIPKGLAVQATRANRNQFEAEKESLLRKASKLRTDAETLAAALEEQGLEFRRRAGEDDRTFGSVTTMDIESALRERGFEIERKRIQLDEPIKAIGEYTVGVRLHHDVTARLKVTVSREE